ncbi:hypothetical protein LUZ60_010086 [Juncus effusus]|nr:hypothetical protein LUZ60_010086 [Juncus effusus]
MMAGVGEMLASALVGEVVSKLSSSLWNEIGLLYNFRTDLEDIKGTLTQLIAFLEDAERQSRRGHGGSMSKWLERLKSATKDIGDLISNYEARIPVNGEKNSDKLKLIISNFFSEFNTLLIAHKIKGMRKKLNNIAAEKAYFTDVVGFDEQQEINNRATTSDLETIIVGREKEKEKLVHLLLDAKEEGDFGIIAIVGFGGLGKTTLAQLVFNDKRVNEPAFHLKAWVYVSMKFDFKKIVENLIESIKNSRGNPGTYNTEEDACKELQGLLQGKKFLIVLDDLWEENWKNLDKLKRVLRGGMKSSKVILTTRTGIIAISMGAQPHFIEFLSDENCWRLFSQKAFKSDVERGNKELVEIGKQIVQKCKGVPLAAQALGAIMPFKDGVDAWKSVRDSDLWELEEESELLSKLEILPSLKLSYYNMPSCLKLCFAYCSIFPKGSQIKKS